MLMNFVREHDNRLLKRAPCFFNLCVPSITEEYKISIFFHTSKKRKTDFGVKMLIVADEATSELMDSFEESFKRMQQHWALLNSIEVFKFLEQKMFQPDCKSFP